MLRLGGVCTPRIQQLDGHSCANTYRHSKHDGRISRDASLQPAQELSELLNKWLHCLHITCLTPCSMRELTSAGWLCPQVSLWCHNVPPRHEALATTTGCPIVLVGASLFGCKCYARRRSTKEHCIGGLCCSALTAFSGAVVSRCSDRSHSLRCGLAIPAAFWTRVRLHDARLHDSHPAGHQVERATSGSEPL
jgi:hypothetical protein